MLGVSVETRISIAGRYSGCHTNEIYSIFIAQQARRMGVGAPTVSEGEVHARTQRTTRTYPTVMATELTVLRKRRAAPAGCQVTAKWMAKSPMVTASPTRKVSTVGGIVLLIELLYLSNCKTRARTTSPSVEQGASGRRHQAGCIMAARAASLCDNLDMAASSATEKKRVVGGVGWGEGGRLGSDPD